eukprot:CAMPEP_0181178492 /NCGR_PEP_ID=MMETSP1096-20121128/5752_1 /TAXON_ID=156174 ORGANISM="Chrysochromulina ericina, Strain CCMP281" /NCGR_SAMPLE_ID=MMETSP1096 /ASSEMBLY_ACC=CAM_ASM_000453 /LENGTH=147 /DNA_ID=CAMNT_0023266771 /DNA_START=49 /DNA_END=490 /DNA_ORIENTATION=+
MTGRKRQSGAPADGLHCLARAQTYRGTDNGTSLLCDAVAREMGEESSRPFSSLRMPRFSSGLSMERTRANRPGVVGEARGEQAAEAFCLEARARYNVVRQRVREGRSRHRRDRGVGERDGISHPRLIAKDDQRQPATWSRPEDQTAD